MTTPKPPTIWVQSDPLPNGTYAAAIHYNDDTARILDRPAGLAYAAEVVAAATYAEHDAAVLRQLVAAGVDLHAAGHTISALRVDRPPLNDGATAPLRLIPGIATSGRGFLRVDIAGEQVGQWSPADARDHASNVLTVLAATTLDAAYRRHLIGPLGLDEARARIVVGDLGDHIRALTSPGGPS
ncbi:hypothetical protein [Streptosporangium sp. NPDC049078]|uniref:hypothetical protein n=1 Tax=Streptosporangium sp. NPDC049078 TaxID=3155767 RepID=UPI0034476724